MDRSLPVTLDYIGEFGPELVLFLPFLNWLSKLGLIRGRRIGTYRGMRCFYDDLGCLEIIEKPNDRIYVPPLHRAWWLPVRNEHDFDGRGRSPQHLYPDLRAKFRKLPLLPEIGSAERPLLIVHNKHNSEWHRGPVNHISLETLRILFRLLGTDFTIVYIRHGMAGTTDGFVEDHNNPLPFDDQRLLAEHPEVLNFDDLYNVHHVMGGLQDVNTFKNVLYSRCHRFISSQGGGAHQIALYSGSLLLILHRRGNEEHWAYSDGYYNFMAAVPPILAICRTDDDLVRALPLFIKSAVGAGRLLLSAGSQTRLAKFSPVRSA